MKSPLTQRTDVYHICLLGTGALAILLMTGCAFQEVRTQQAKIQTLFPPIA